MKVAQINNLCGRGSTGKIAIGISELSNKTGIENKIFYFSKSSSLSNAVKITNKPYIKFQALKSRVLGNYGFNSRSSTRKLIKELDIFNPDIVHIHNIHAHNVHFEMLFNYLRRKKKKIIYTFHDCWALTGYCPHFAMARCEKWKSKCFCCPLYKKYSWFFDKSKTNYFRKKKALSDLDLTIVAPSNWLADIVKESFLKEYPVKVIKNGIDLQVFYPIESNMREEKKLCDKTIVLGVADMWGRSKGLDVFIELSKRLSADFQIILVGVSQKVKKLLPKNIISLKRTQNQNELARIYSMSNVFVNPTREEVLGLVNIEALACGVPVVMFNTGGSPECIDSTCGTIVECDDIDQLVNAISEIRQSNRFSKEDCIKRAKLFDKSDRIQEYIDLYKMCFESKKEIA